MTLVHPTKTPMPALDPVERRSRWDEVAVGYTVERALAEARRCVQCQDPVCEQGCPVGVPIRDFIRRVQLGDFAGAAEVIRTRNVLPAICGRVCPVEHQCEAQCAVIGRLEPVGIGRLERFVADWERAHPRDGRAEAPPRRGERVAIVGSGPAGLTAASDLVRLGYGVTVFEALHAVGGVLRYGIPEFRLPKAIVDEDVDRLARLGVEFRTDVVVGKTITIDELLGDEGYAAVFVGTGAGSPKFMGIPGENLKGVYSANEYLTRVNLMRAYDFPGYDTPVKRPTRAAVIGAGDTAMDAARVSIRLGAEEAHVVYRRSEAEMGARREDFERAVEEGAIFDWLTLPVRFLGDEAGRVRALECIRMELGEPDESGRARPVPISGSEFELEANLVVIALGTNPNPLVPQTTSGLEIDGHGCIVVDPETGETSRPGVYAGGDIATGAATVILAMGAGRRAAAAIHEYLEGREPAPARPAEIEVRFSRAQDAELAFATVSRRVPGARLGSAGIEIACDPVAEVAVLRKLEHALDEWLVEQELPFTAHPVDAHTLVVRPPGD